MARTEHYHTKFEADRLHHLYNRAIGKELLFKTPENYRFFLKKYHWYLDEYVDTYVYCLRGNHFHFLIRVKPLQTLQGLAKIDSDTNTVHGLVAHQLQKLFQSYALAFNKQQGRIGTLFQKPFKRALVNEDAYLTALINYIHLNTQNHGLVADFKKWNWSSYHSIISDKDTHLCRREALDWFGGIDEFVSLQNDENLVDTLKIDE